MTTQISNSEKWGIRSFIEIALNDKERASYLAKSLAGRATKSSLCEDEASLQTLVYTGLAFIEELGLDPESTSKAITERLEFNGNGYQSGLLKKLDPKLGEVANFALNIKKVSAVLKKWQQINSDIPEPGIDPEIGDIFSFQVEQELIDQSLTNEVARLHKIFKSPFKDKAIIDFGSDVKVVMEWSEEEKSPVIHQDTIDLWIEDHGINTPAPDHIYQQLSLLSEYFLNSRKSYMDLKEAQKQREKEYGKGVSVSF